MADERPLEGLKILVAEDEPDERAYLVCVLEEAGATVISAQNGDDALDRASTELPDILTLDVLMPGMDTSEVYRKLREDTALSGLRVCIVSGRPELRAVLFDRFEWKPDAYLDKPVSAEQLVSAIRGLRG